MKSKIKEVSIGKEFKMGLPNYSNITARCDIKWEIAEGEEPDWDAMWDEVNKQVQAQTDTDQSWLKTDEFKNFYKTTIKTRKGGEQDE